METKFIVLIVLILALLAAWLVPRTRLASSLTFSERTYKLIHWTGVLCAVAGIGLSLMRPETIMQDHVYELILLPVLAAYAIYPAIVSRIRSGRELLDEKQIADTTHAAGLSLAVTTMTMFIVYAFYAEGTLTGLIWFPLFVFSVVGWYSAWTLYLHGTS